MSSGSNWFTPSLAVSVILHAGLGGALLFGGFLFPSKTSAWGSPDGGSGIQVKVSSGIPGIYVPTPAPVSPGEKSSESPGWKPPETGKIDKPTTQRGKGPKEPKPPVTRGGVPIPDASADVKPSAEPSGPIATAATTSVPSNAVTGVNSGGTAPSLYGTLSSGTGTASVGFSEKAFGDQFGWYADRLTAAVTQYWQPAPGASSAPRVYVIFTINKDGSIADLEIERKSNNDALDNSAKRAILQAAAAKLIPPLPNDFRGSKIKARLSFEYR